MSVRCGSQREVRLPDVLNSHVVGVRTSLLRTGIVILLLCLASAAFSGCTGSGSDDGSVSPEPTPATTPIETPPAGVQNVPVLSIRSSNDPDVLLGSAVVLDSNGLLVTSIEILDSDRRGTRFAIGPLEGQQDLRSVGWFECLPRFDAFSTFLQ